VRITHLCYNNHEVSAMSAQVDQLIKEVQQLPVDELRVLCKAVLQKLAIPLSEPEMIYDDWNDPEVDAAYADTW